MLLSFTQRRVALSGKAAKSTVSLSSPPPPPSSRPSPCIMSICVTPLSSLPNVCKVAQSSSRARPFSKSPRPSGLALFLLPSGSISGKERQREIQTRISPACNGKGRPGSAYVKSNLPAPSRGRRQQQVLARQARQKSAPAGMSARFEECWHLRGEGMF